MPKIFGTNLLGILAATIVFYTVGWLWYGMLFMEQWAALTGTETGGDMEMTTIIGGLLITLLQVLGISYILQHAGASTLATCVKICAIIALLLALPLLAYAMIYENGPRALFHIDASHIFVGYILVGAVLSFFRGKDAIDDV